MVSFCSTYNIGAHMTNSQECKLFHLKVCTIPQQWLSPFSNFRNDRLQGTIVLKGALMVFYKHNVNNTALQKKKLMSMINFYVFLAAESEYDIRFASSRLDLAVPDLWIFTFLLKSEKTFSSVSDLKL